MTGIAETTPCENTNDPTPRSIYNYQTVKPVIEWIPRGARTRETPYVSHLANERGNTGKSTARIERTVIRIMWALYVVKAGSWTIGDC